MCPYDGFSFPEVEPRLFSFNSPYGACPACNGLGTKHFMGEEPCPVCHGARLRPEALNVFLEKEQQKTRTSRSLRQAVRRKEGRFNIVEITNFL
jgi:excinuclease ABC subunit A